MYVCDSDQDSKNLQTDIDSALTGVLWQMPQFGAGGEDWGELNLHLDGSASRYFEQIKRVMREQPNDTQTNSSDNCPYQTSFRNGDFPSGYNLLPERRCAGSCAARPFCSGGTFWKGKVV